MRMGISSRGAHRRRVKSAMIEHRTPSRQVSHLSIGVRTRIAVVAGLMLAASAAHAEECCDPYERCRDNGSIFPGLAFLDTPQPQTCNLDEVVFDLLGNAIDSGASKELGCPEPHIVSIPPGVILYSWEIMIPGGGTISGAGRRAVAPATALGTYVCTFTATVQRECPPDTLTIGSASVEVVSAQGCPASNASVTVTYEQVQPSPNNENCRGCIIPDSTPCSPEPRGVVCLFGLTALEHVINAGCQDQDLVDFEVCCANGQWTPRVTSAKVKYSKQVCPRGGTEILSGLESNISNANCEFIIQEFTPPTPTCPAPYLLYFPRSCVEAHENRHVTDIQTAFNAGWPAAQAAIEGLQVQFSSPNVDSPEEAKAILRAQVCGMVWDWYNAADAATAAGEENATLVENECLQAIVEVIRTRGFETCPP